MTQGSTLNIWHIGRWPPSDGRRPSAMEDDKLNKWVLSLKRTSHFGGWRNRLPFSPRTIEFSAYTNKTWALEHNISQWHQLYRLELFQADWLHHVTSLVLKNVQGPCSLGHIIMLYKFSFHVYAENSMVLGENWNSCLTHWKITSNDGRRPLIWFFGMAFARYRPSASWVWLPAKNTLTLNVIMNYP